MNYQELDSGLAWQGYELAVFDNELYVGGSLGSASGVPNTIGIARWNDTATAVSNIQPLTPVTIYPNPAREEFTACLPDRQVYGLAAGQAGLRFTVERIELYTVLGERILANQYGGNNMQEQVSMAGFPSGMYFVKVFTKNGEVTLKVVKQ